MTRSFSAGLAARWPGGCRRRPPGGRHGVGLPGRGQRDLRLRRLLLHGGAEPGAVAGDQQEPGRPVRARRQYPGSSRCRTARPSAGPPASSAAPWTVSATASAISRSATPGRMSGCSPARAPMSNLKLNNLRVSDNTHAPVRLRSAPWSGSTAGVSPTSAPAGFGRRQPIALQRTGRPGRQYQRADTNASVSGGVTAYAASTAAGGLVGENFTTAWGPEAVIERPQQRPCGCTVHRAQQPGRRRRPGRTECEGHDQRPAARGRSRPTGPA